MKILLINPPHGDVYGGLKKPIFPPLGLAYIGAVLERENHNVKILDMDAENTSHEEFQELLRDEKYELVGITTTTPTYNNAKRLCDVVKEEIQAKTVIGGIHATIMPEESIAPKNIDFLVKGEGEQTICELADSLDKNKGLHGIKGLVYKENGNIVVNEPRELIKDLDVLPHPAWHLFRHIKYVFPDSLSSHVFPVMSSRGCPGRCSFCSAKSIFLRKFRPRSAQNVVDEIEDLVKRYSVREIHLWDDNFTLNKSRVLEIKDQILRRGIRVKIAFMNGLRVDCVDREILKALKEMGTYSIAFGVESGNQNILNSIKKGITTKKIEEAFEIAREFKIETWGFFMIGFPQDTERTIRETIDFAIKLDPDIAKFHVLKPYPGTDIFDELNQKGLITDRNFDNYGIHTKPVHRLESLSEDDLLRLQKTAYKEFYFRPKKIIKQILRLKSFNRMKLNIQLGLSLIKNI